MYGTASRFVRQRDGKIRVYIEFDNDGIEDYATMEFTEEEFTAMKLRKKARYKMFGLQYIGGGNDDTQWRFLGLDESPACPHCGGSGNAIDVE